MIAFVALLLASSLEICGCDLAPDCEQIRNLQLSESNSPAVSRRCAACLSSEEMDKLLQARKRLANSAALERMQDGETIGQALLGADRLTFYAPDSNAYEGADGTRFVAIPPNPALPSASWPRPWPISQSVFLVYEESGANRETGRRIPAAAAFVVSIPSLDHRSSVRFLVTARHVVDPLWAHCSERNPASIVVRLNRWSGGSAYEHIPLEENHNRLYAVPADDTVDIAVIRLDGRLIPNIEAYNFMDTPYRLLPTPSELAAIAKSQQESAFSGNRPIVTAGLKTQPFPEQRSFPVSDAGTLTSSADAPVDIQCGAASGPMPLRIWMIDAAVQKEVSGAPVYTTMLRSGANTETPVLLGVQSVAWPNRRAAGITPSDALGELIQSALGSSGQKLDFYRGPIP
jgi:hypothetical protein